METGSSFEQQPCDQIVEPQTRTNTQTFTAFDIVDQLVSGTYRMPKSALHAGTRCRKTVAFARQVAMYLCHVGLSYPLKDVAKHYSRDRTTVAYACRIVEDRREDEEIELLISSLESALQTMKHFAPVAWNSSE